MHSTVIPFSPNCCRYTQLYGQELRLTPKQFELVCTTNREAALELAAVGRVMAMTPTGSETGARNSRLEMRLLLQRLPPARSRKASPQKLDRSLVPLPP